VNRDWLNMVYAQRDRGRPLGGNVRKREEQQSVEVSRERTLLLASGSRGNTKDMRIQSLQGDAHYSASKPAY